MPKALFFVPVDGPGGAERVIASAARYLAKRLNWDVKIISLAARVEISFLDQIDERVHVSYGTGGGGALSEWVSLRRALDARYDVVFSSHVRINAALCAARTLGALRTRRLVTRESTVFADRVSPRRMFGYRALYGLYGSQDEIWAQTSYMAGRLCEVVRPGLAQRITIVPNPVDADHVRQAAQAGFPRAMLPSTARRVVWCGRLIDIKAPRSAIEAVEVARRETGEDIRLTIIGTGPLAADLQAFVRDRSLAEVVELVGHQQDPYPLMARGEIGLLTSVREGFPNVLLEMMAVGLRKIITTPCAGDLQSLTGVDVASDHSPTALGAILARAVSTRADARGDYSAVLERRTPAAFVQRLIGGGDQASRPLA